MPVYYYTNAGLACNVRPVWCTPRTYVQRSKPSKSGFAGSARTGVPRDFSRPGFSRERAGWVPLRPGSSAPRERANRCTPRLFATRLQRSAGACEQVGPRPSRDSRARGVYVVNHPMWLVPFTLPVGALLAHSKCFVPAPALSKCTCAPDVIVTSAQVLNKWYTL